MKDFSLGLKRSIREGKVQEATLVVQYSYEEAFDSIHSKSVECGMKSVYPLGVVVFGRVCRMCVCRVWQTMALWESAVAAA